jgi:hypothetical protein
MIYNDKSIESLIIRCLQHKELTIVDLIRDIAKKRGGATKQGVYRAIAKLREAEVVVVFDKKISLNKSWIQEMSDFFSATSKYYSEQPLTDTGFLNLEEGDRAVYRFKSPYVADRFWAHAFSVLSATIKKTTPIYIYNPHEWFLIARRESERRLFDDLKKDGRLLLVTIGHNDSLDQHIRKDFDQNLSQYAIDTSFHFKENYYVNIFDDYIIEVYLDKKVSKDISAFYAEEIMVTAESIAKLQHIISQKGQNRFVISRNKKKTRELSKRLSKNFYIPKELINA